MSESLRRKLAEARANARRCENVALYGLGGSYRRDVHREEALEWRAMEANILRQLGE